MYVLLFFVMGIFLTQVCGIRDGSHLPIYYTFSLIEIISKKSSFRRSIDNNSENARSYM
jgi:hypothetical protein